MNKNNDTELAKNVAELQKLTLGLDAAMREDRDMIRYLSLVEHAARLAGWAALAHYNRTIYKQRVA